MIAAISYGIELICGVLALYSRALQRHGIARHGSRIDGSEMLRQSRSMFALLWQSEEKQG